ncbi:J517_1871 family lipoprotein [Brenneria goodwinii]|uniref:J517_1871 family lipoprotein n=1 Tax=Brenneria goodwinii TaxID=1109412 RepID=UPI0011AB6319|nr:J517_1871 family lipoprotein [Brenneria goodwinii]
MNKVILGLSFLLAGCATDDLLKNDFPSVVEKNAPSNLVGVWTGSTGPYLTTLIIKENGSGLSCYSWNNNNAIGKIKYDGQEIRLQDGSRLQIKNIDELNLIAHAPYYMGADYTFYKDNELKNASPYCEKEISIH